MSKHKIANPSQESTYTVKGRTYRAADLYEAFDGLCQAMSHPLKDPLRQALLNIDELRQGASAEASGLCDETSYAISQVLERIELVKQFAALVQNKHRTTTVDCNQVLSKAVDSLQPHKALVTADPLPAIQAKEEQMEMLFRHVIDNAILYNHSSLPKVHISAKEKEKMWEFRISDNGTGLDEVYHELVFSPFQSLDGLISTHGMGLAFCKQIIKNHNGKIWFVPEEGGTSFYFTVPRE